MCFTTKRGFTLLEILVAVAISSIIMLGLFEIFNSVMDARSYALKKGSTVELVSKIIRLMDSDIRCKIGTFTVSEAFGMTKLEFKTTHSLFFAGSLPVTVAYYIEKEDNKYVLIREETSRAAGEDIMIPLTDYFKKIKFEFYSHSRWTDVPGKIIRVVLYTINNNKYTFACRGMVE